MLVSLNWLKQYVDLGSETPETLADKITKTGIEVEGIDYVSERLDHVVVGYVESCEKHPDADKLNVTKVNVGDEVLQIVCGAPNVAKGQHVVVAKVGAVLPGNFKIKQAKLRGIESNGMICSLQELGIQEQYVPKDLADGIFVFNESVQVGRDVTDYLNLDDAILELGLTPNRSDALSMLGVAYEVAAILNEEVILPDETYTTTDEQATDLVSVKVEATDDNPYYGAFVAKNVTIKPAPLWMRNYLMAAGIRPINNVVDITNYVLLEYGQPLHAFDLDKFGSDQIVVRRATDNETFITLDEETRTLSNEHLVITNGQTPQALAGVMGGFESEVSDATTTVLLEAAYFDGKRVRQAVKDHGLRSESSTRFEKGVDPNRVKRAGHRALHLLEKYADADICIGVSEQDVLDYSEQDVVITTERINDRLGTTITDQEIAIILDKLQFTYDQDQSTFTVHVPTRRQDITIFEDMLEEVARIYGYDYLDYTLPEGGQFAGKLTERQALKRFVKQVMEGAGLSEAITYSLTTTERATMLVAPDIHAQAVSPVRLAMPMSEEHSTLRLSLLPELLAVASYNQARKEKDIALYEVGTVFVSDEKEITKQPKELNRLAGILNGQWLTHPFQQEHKAVDFYVAKGIVETLVNRLGIDVTFTKAEIDGMHPGRTAEVYHEGQSIGFIGQVHPTLAKSYDLKAVYVFDLDLEYLYEHVDLEPSFNQIPRFPSMSRDIALVMDEMVPSGDVLATIKQAAGEHLFSLHVFDVYQGEHLPAGKKSLAFNLRYLDPARTLTDEEVEASYEAVLAAVKSTHGAVLRA